MDLHRVLVLALSLCLIVLVTDADGADLYRLASSASGPLYPGCTVEVAITCDHSRFPTQTPLDPNRALRALSFGLELPAPLQYAGYTFDGTYLKQFLGQNPDFAAVNAVTGGVTIGIVLDWDVAQSLPEGLNQSIIKIRVGVPAGTPSQTIPLNIVGTLGSPVVARELLMPLGLVTATARNGRVTITAGTCSIGPAGGFWPAAVGLLQSDPDANAESTKEEVDPADKPGYYTDSDWDISDPTTLPFEEPTPDELQEPPGSTEPVADGAPLSVADAAKVDGEGGAVAMGMSGAGDFLTSKCDVDIEVGAVPTGGTELVVSTSPGAGEYDEIQDAIEAAADGTGDYLIKVEAGTYEENVFIDASLWDDRRLILYSESGPGLTTIDPPPPVPPADDSRPIMITDLGAADGDGGEIYIGWVETPSELNDDPTTTGWRGFTITGGSAGLNTGAGIYVTSVDCAPKIRIAGNIVTANGLVAAETALEGGGIGIDQANDVVIYQNEIEGNRATRIGAGVAIWDAEAVVAENWIHDNSFLESPVAGFEQFKMGGGIGISIGSAAVLCRNQIYENQARQGCGVFCFLRDFPPSDFLTPTPCPENNEVFAQLHMEENVIRQNAAWIDPTPDEIDCGDNPDGMGGFSPDPPFGVIGYRGGGVYIEATGVEPFPFPNYPLDDPRITLLNNDVYLNNISIDGTDECFLDSDGDGVPDPDGLNSQVGGGLYVSLDLRGTPVAPEHYIIGNFIHQNTARYAGGGAWLYATEDITAGGVTPNELFPFHHNTVVENMIDDAREEGGGIYLAVRTETDAFYPRYEGRNNIVFNNVPLEANWYAACHPAGDNPNYDDGLTVWDVKWQFSQLPQPSPDADLPADCTDGVEIEEQYNIYRDPDDPASGVGNDDDSDIRLVSDVNPHIARFDSPCVDTGTNLVGLPVDLDIDGDVRPHDDIAAYWPVIADKGADEFTALPPVFKRGDCDGNGSVSGLLDALYILVYSFQSGPIPPCMDAADVDGNNLYSALLDALYLLTYAFSSGDDPPAPGPTVCGPDVQPDDDGLGCVAGDTSCVGD